MTLKPLEGVKAYRLPTINPGYSNYGQIAPSGHLRPLVSKVSSCVIDTPRDNELGYREDLWSFQKHHRGVRHSDDVAPDIPFRLRSNDLLPDEHGMDSSLGFPCLDSYGPSLVSDGSFLRQLSRTRTTFANTDPIPRVKDKDAPFIAKGVSIPFTKSMRLVSRDRRSPKASPARNGGSVTERLPRMSGSKPEVNDVPSLKKSSSLMDVREDSYERASVNSDDVSSVSIDITSDKVGHTTNAVIDTTLADILNRHNSGKYYDLGNKNSELSHNNNDGHRNRTNNDRQWSHKFETKIVDGGLYDNFARTRKPDIDKEKKCESKTVKRHVNQRLSDQDIPKTATSAEGCLSRKTSTGQSKKQSKLKVSLSNNKTSD